MQLSAHQKGYGERKRYSTILVTGAMATLPGVGYWLALLAFRFYEHPEFVAFTWPLLRPVLSVSLILCPLAICIALFVFVRGVINRNIIDGVSAALWSLSAVLFASMFLHFFSEAGAGV